MILSHDVTGSGPAVLLLHAGVADSRMWEPQRAPLAEHHRVIRCDLRGYGDTPLTSAAFDNAGDVKALLGERATDESIAQVRDQYGLDDPFYEQYWRYLQTIGSGDLGTSIRSRRPITSSAPWPAASAAIPAGIRAAILAPSGSSPSRIGPWRHRSLMGSRPPTTRLTTRSKSSPRANTRRRD